MYVHIKIGQCSQCYSFLNFRRLRIRGRERNHSGAVLGTAEGEGMEAVLRVSALEIAKSRVHVKKVREVARGTAEIRDSWK